MPKLNTKSKIPEILDISKIPLKFQEYTDQMLCQQKNKKLKYLPSKIIKYDIKILETLPTSNLYLQFSEIIEPFWKYFASPFYDYFTKNYVDQTQNVCLSGWQNFLKKYLPGTNNSLEAYNNIMKYILT